MLKLLGSAAALLAVTAITASAYAASEKLEHRFLDIAVSPDGNHIATVEGDSPAAGGFPVVQSLMIRTTDGKDAKTVALPCGAVRECSPASLATSTLQPWRRKQRAVPAVPQAPQGKPNHGKGKPDHDAEAEE